MKLPDTNNARGRFMVQAGEKGATLSFPNKFAKRIKNRGVTYSVPTKHLETTIEDTSAENLISIVLPTFGDILDQAKKLEPR